MSTPINMKYTFALIGFMALYLWPNSLLAQQDTIYFDNNWKETVKDSAAFFRPPVKMENDLFRIKDYYISGQLQMSGLSQSDNKTFWHGEVSWYNADGTLLQKGGYTHNRLNGKFITYLNNKKLVAIYDNGYFVSGAMNRSQNYNNYYLEIKNDTLKEVIYDTDMNGIRYENYSLVKGTRFLSKYYDEKGKLVATLKTLDNGYTQGDEVFYYYNPMRLKQINHYPYERFLAETVYYPNEQLRTKFELEPEYKKTYFTENGTKLGSITYTLENDYLKPENGTEYFFTYGYNEDEGHVVSAVKTYENGKILKDELKYDNGQVKSITTYNDNKKELQISYDENGTEIARMTYENYYPLNGTEIIGDRKSTYANGELVKEINYYPKTDSVFSEKTTEKETYFNKEGEVIGELEIDYQNKYAKPMDGKRFFVGYDTDISSIEVYKDGFVTERTVFRSKLMAENEKLEFKRTEYYEDDGYKKIREVVYYSNGVMQSDIEYKGYDKKFGKFYNDKGELIGTYDYVKKDGKLYEFFDDSNVVRLIQEETNGNITKLKRYDYGPYRKYGDVDALLVEELDVTCCYKSYKRNGELFTEAKYKDGQPWEGALYDAASRTKISIKDGMRNGAYKKFDYNQELILEEGQYLNDKKEGVFNTFDFSGQLKYSQTYTDGQLHGKTIFYDKGGKPLTSLVYKNGQPFEGTKIILMGYNRAPNEETYSNGELTQRISYDDIGKRITKFVNGEEVETIAYHKDSDKKRLKYTLDNYYINGEVIRYDKNGKETHKALFKNNKLESGVVYLSSRDTYDKRVAYVILKKLDRKISVTMMGHDEDIVFFAEEIIEQGYALKYINRLNLYIDNLTPESLY